MKEFVLAFLSIFIAMAVCPLSWGMWGVFFISAPLYSMALLWPKRHLIMNYIKKIKTPLDVG